MATSGFEALRQSLGQVRGRDRVASWMSGPLRGREVSSCHSSPRQIAQGRHAHRELLFVPLEVGAGRVATHDGVVAMEQQAAQVIVGGSGDARGLLPARGLAVAWRQAQVGPATRLSRTRSGFGSEDDDYLMRGVGQSATRPRRRRSKR